MARFGNFAQLQEEQIVAVDHEYDHYNEEYGQVDEALVQIGENEGLFRPYIAVPLSVNNRQLVLTLDGHLVGGLEYRDNNKKMYD